VSTGHLVFLRRGVLFAVPFDAERVEVRGAPVPVLDGVAQALTSSNSNDVTGAGQFAISPIGTLAWVPSPVVPDRDATLVTVDRRGQVSPLGAPVRSYAGELRIAPNGHRLAVTAPSPTEVGLWVYDLDRGSLSPVNREGEASWPLWSPDGSRLVFNWLANGRASLALQSADGSAPPRVIAAGRLRPSSFTPDGRHVAAVTLADTFDIAVVTDAPGTPAVQPLIQTPNHEQWPELSPDGHWLAYGSNVSDRTEIYVRRYPELGAAQPVSLDGGVSPAWHPNGREIFFVSPPNAAGKQRMMAAAFGAGSPPRLGRPQLLFEFDARELMMSCVPVRCYDVAPDGSGFYAVQYRTTPPPPPVTHINLIQNWVEELKAKVPTR
jgi:serine/threonine-protein kinase